MVAVALFLHHHRPEAVELAADATRWLTERGHEVRLPAPDAELAGRPDLAHGDDDISVGLDLAISLGGDGTMLRSIDCVSPAGVPVIGVNLGQLGYLVEVEPTGIRMALKRFLAGAYELEERMLLSVALARAGEPAGPPVASAMNEAVLEKTPMGHTVRLSVSVDGEFFTTYAADGLIVATPTGSTAYSFSARGPIIAPAHRALLLTPVSPHMLFDRSLVLDPTAVVRLEVRQPRPATLSVDGRNLGDLEPGDAVECTAAPWSAHVVTFGHHDFLRILKGKFGLSDR